MQNARENITSSYAALKKAVTLALLIILAYLPTFLWMVQRWTDENSYYNHGFLVPLISIFLIWLKEEKLFKMKTQPDNLGWVFFIPGISLHLISILLKVSFTSGFSLILVLLGLVLLFLGRDHLKELLFPILFLTFMIPLPLIALANIGFRLKILAAQISTLLINKLGIPAVREGSIIKTAHTYLIVEDPCAGLRYLLALIALGVLMVYFLNISRLKKVLILLCAVPIAVCANIIRIMVLLLIGETYGAQYTTGIFHGIIGMLIFGVAFVGLFWVGKLLE